MTTPRTKSTLIRRIKGAIRGKSRTFDNGDGPDGQILPRTLTHDTLYKAYQSQWKGVQCAFTLSTGRAGTVTLAKLLGLAPSIYALHEPSPALLKASQQAYMCGDSQVRDPAAWDLIIDVARAEMVWDAHVRKRIYVETNNRATYLAPTLARFFPESKFILLHRSPLQVIQSEVERGAYVANSWDEYRVTPTATDPYFDQWGDMSALEKTAWCWQAVYRFSLNFVDTLPEERKLSVASEALFASDPQTLRGIFDFFGATLPPERQIQTVIDRKWNQARTANSRAEPALTSDDVARIRDIVGDVAQALGYDI